MDRRSPEAGLSHGALARLLARWQAGPRAGQAPGFVEGLSRWLDWTDAIPLAAALQDDDPPRPAPRGPRPRATRAALAAACMQLRATLRAAFADDGLPGRPNTRSPDRHDRSMLPTTMPNAQDLDLDACRRRYSRHQRTMEVAVDALRQRVREAVAAASVEHARLARVDEVLERVVAERERLLLACLPAALEQRLAQRRQAHLAALALQAGADDPAGWWRPGGWLAALGDDVAALLDAELDLRLQPVLGLIDALPADEPTTCA